MTTPWAFDDPQYRRLTVARQDAVYAILRELQSCTRLTTALDAGCGVGAFSCLLHEMGMETAGVDGRPANVAEARRRLPHIRFDVANVEDANFAKLGVRDLVLCTGLLYHLENPFLAVRNLHEVTGKILLVESMCVPDEDAVLRLRDEGATGDQGMAHVALYPSASCLQRLCYTAGFPYVYRLRRLPQHEHFCPANGRERIRTMFLASKIELNLPSLELADRVAYRQVPGSADANGENGSASRLMRFLGKSPEEKIQALRWRWNRAVPSLPWSIRLPWGSRWLPREDGFDYSSLVGAFKPSEYCFLTRVLRPGMTVLDVGAHRGLFTLLAAQKVGASGKVIAFEPSPRDRRFLADNLRINGCANVQVRGEAVAEQTGQAELHLVESHESGCNSLRPPSVEGAIRKISVPVTTLDQFLAHSAIERVDLMKIDVEGAELSVLQGARNLLQKKPRPRILMEVSDLRTAAWNYRASQVLHFLKDLGFGWFEPIGPGDLRPIDLRRDYWDDNFVAVPEELLPAHREARDSEGAAVKA